MLTSSLYLLGGFLAAACATGALLQTHSLATSNVPAAPGVPARETVDIAYRGSGRLDDSPVRKKVQYTSLALGKNIVAHRGSGRIRPSSI